MGAGNELSSSACHNNTLKISIEEQNHECVLMAVVYYNLNERYDMNVNKKKKRDSYMPRIVMALNQQVGNLCFCKMTTFLVNLHPLVFIHQSVRSLIKVYICLQIK